MAISTSFKSALYSLYARRLLEHLRQGPLPRHVAITLDGNRRFARLRGLPSPASGYQLGAEKFQELLEWCDELAIPVVTVWALSMDNLGRDPEELHPLVELIEDGVKALTDGRPRRLSARSIHALGRPEVLPESLQRTIASAEERTAHLGPLRLNIALGYDGREEITQAVRNLLVERAQDEVPLHEVARELTPEDIGKRLYCQDAPDPDLIIRTSGELRLSGFLLWQSAYSELYFCDALWPAFRKVDFLRALRSYQQRERRFGR